MGGPLQWEHLCSWSTCAMEAPLQWEDIYNGSTFTAGEPLQWEPLQVKHLGKGSTFTSGAPLQYKHLSNGSNLTIIAPLQWENLCNGSNFAIGEPLKKKHLGNGSTFTSVATMPWEPLCNLSTYKVQLSNFFSCGVRLTPEHGQIPAQHRLENAWLEPWPDWNSLACTSLSILASKTPAYSTKRPCMNWPWQLKYSRTYGATKKPTKGTALPTFQLLATKTFNLSIYIPPRHGMSMKIWRLF